MTPISTWTAILIGTVIKPSMILACAFGATLAARRQSAALRHWIWTVGLFSALALPVLGAVVPSWQPDVARFAASSFERIGEVKRSAIEITPQRIVPATGQAVDPLPETNPEKSNGITPAPVIVSIWILGIVALSSLLLREAVRLTRVAKGATAVHQSSWRELVHEISLAIFLTRDIQLLKNPNASVLGTWGTIHPRVLLPRESDSWSSERKRIVLGHELSHVKRNDWLVQVVAEIARAIYWFNPLFWIACAELRRESEHACDDAAIQLSAQVGIDGPAYASHVLDLVRTLKHAGRSGAVALAMAGTSNLERRLIAMLNPSLNRGVATRGKIAAVVLSALCLTLPLAAVSAKPPVPAGTVVQLTEPILQIPAATAPAAVAPRTVQQTKPRPIERIASASPGYVEAVPVVATQNPTGTLSGTISDQTGAVVPGVSISIMGQSTGLSRRTLSTSSGNFTFEQLAPDSYSGTVDLPGFKQGKYFFTLSDPGSSARLNFTLQIAPVNATVDVTATPPDGVSVTGVLPPRGAAVEPSTSDGSVVVNPPPNVTAPSLIPGTGRPYPIRVGGDLQDGNFLITHPTLAYPSEARSRGVQGIVVLSGVVAEDGHMRSLKVISSSDPLLENSVAETIQKWTYKPTLLNGTPIETTATITVTFSLAR